MGLEQCSYNNLALISVGFLLCICRQLAKPCQVSHFSSNFSILVLGSLSASQVCIPGISDLVMWPRWAFMSSFAFDVLHCGGGHLRACSECLEKMHGGFSSPPFDSAGPPPTSTPPPPPFFLDLPLLWDWKL